MRRFLALGGVALVALVVAAPAASAGGWATSSLDPISTMVVGQATEVGFTIRQHGVTPVDYDIGAVAVVVRSPSGETEEFPARRDGSPGHFVADVTFPESGPATWSIEQGDFGVFDLGSIEVGTAAAAATTSAPSDLRWPLAARLLVPLVAAGGLALVAMDGLGRRRRAEPSELAEGRAG
jgi:hypothetical protein